MIVPGAPSADNQAVLTARREWATSCLPPGAPGRHLRRDGHDVDRPIRLGYVSSFFNKRNWMKPVWGLINHQDRDRFEIHLFSDAPESVIGDQYRKHPLDRFHDARSLSNSALARLIQESRSSS